MMKNAFVDSNGVLVSFGYAGSNGSDILVEVPDDFDMPTGATQYQNGEWVAYIPPMTWAKIQQQAMSALVESDRTILRCYENGVSVPSNWAAYRKSLRAIVAATAGDPTQSLPPKPAYPPST
jgi:hypothetical protein